MQRLCPAQDSGKGLNGNPHNIIFRLLGSE